MTSNLHTRVKYNTVDAWKTLDLYHHRGAL